MWLKQYVTSLGAIMGVTRMRALTCDKYGKLTSSSVILSASSWMFTDVLSWLKKRYTFIKTIRDTQCTMRRELISKRRISTASKTARLSLLHYLNVPCANWIRSCYRLSLNKLHL